MIETAAQTAPADLDDLDNFDLYAGRPHEVRAAGHASAATKRAQLVAAGRWNPLTARGVEG